MKNVGKKEVTDPSQKLFSPLMVSQLEQLLRLPLI